VSLPTFIVIGPGRAGTTWIYEVLRAHPQVCMAQDTKETLFFDREYERGIDWYKRFFVGCEEACAVGEVSNTYIYDASVPTRIRLMLPDCTLITCLRNPVERIQSVYHYRRRSGTLDLGFEAALVSYPELVTDNRYWTQLQRYLAHFPVAQVRVLFYDDLVANPYAFLRQLYDTVGVDRDFVPAVVSQRINPAAKARSPALAKLARAGANVLRGVGLHALLDCLKRSRVVRGLLMKPLVGQEEQVMSDATRQALIKRLKPEIEGVARWTGRDLSDWLK